MIDKTLLDILACPACQGNVTLEKGSAGVDRITCISCGRKYPIKNGIPVLIIDQAIK